MARFGGPFLLVLMKQAFRHFMAPEEGGESGSTAGGSFGTVSDAVAELERRESARRAETKAAKQAKEAAKSSDEADVDPDDPDYEEPKPRKDDKPEKAEKKPPPKAKEEPEDSDEEDDEESSDDLEDSDPEEDEESSKERDDRKTRKVATDEDDSADADDSLEEIEHEGKKHRVPKELKDAFLRQSDYTRKTQEVAEARKQVEQTWRQAQETAQQLEQTQRVLAQFAQAVVGQAPDLSLAQQDPQTYLVQKGLYEQRMSQLQELMSHGQMLSQQQQQMSQRAQQQYLAEQSNKLLEAIPELRDQNKRAAFRDQAIQTAQAYGFAPDEITAIADHRMLLVLRDLAKAQRQASRSAEAQASVKKKLANVPPKVAKPQASNGDSPVRDEEAKRAFMKSGRTLKDAMRYLDRTSR